MATSLLRLGVALGCCFLATHQGFATEKFKRLSAEEFLRLFVDRTVDAMDLGRIKRGLWRFTRGELCMDFTERGKPVSECYEILVSGKNVRFLRDGVLIVEVRLLGCAVWRAFRKLT